MNFYFWASLHPKTFTWRWLPSLRFRRRLVHSALGDHAWNLSFSWLNFGLNVDNEW
jgi:hypothetical protein